MGTLGGPQSYGDAGHGAANINNAGVAAGEADTNIPDPFYPLWNPAVGGPLIGPYPYVYHAFTTKGSTLIDLGSLPGANDSTAIHITENGLVSGNSLNGSIDPLNGLPEANAVLWINEQIINLGTLGGYESAAGTVNSRGQVVGQANNNVPDPYTLGGTQQRAFLWDQKNGMQDLGTLGGPDATACCINERGQIVGASFINNTPNPGSGLPTFDPFFWDHGTMIDLGGLGGTMGMPGGINNRGQVVGNSNLPGDLTFHGFLWDRGTLTDIGTPGGSWSSANAFNEAGHIVGQGGAANGEGHAFFWKRGVMIDLGPLPGFPDSTCVGAFGINSHDQVIGQAVQNFCAGPAADAFLWENGEMVDVNNLVPPGTDLTLVEIEHINDSGEMFGEGTLQDGSSRAFLLIPCDDDHPGIDGCDYSMVDADAAATAVTRAPAPKIASPFTQGNPAFGGAMNPMLRHFSRRPLGPWYRGMGAENPAMKPTSTATALTTTQTPSQGASEQSASCSAQSSDFLLGAETAESAVTNTNVVHGYCLVNGQVLTGGCLGHPLGTIDCVGKGDTQQCPTGAKAKQPRLLICGRFPWPIDLARPCSFKFP